MAGDSRKWTAIRRAVDNDRVASREDGHAADTRPEPQDGRKTVDEEIQSPSQKSVRPAARKPKEREKTYSKTLKLTLRD